MASTKTRLPCSLAAKRHRWPELGFLGRGREGGFYWVFEGSESQTLHLSLSQKPRKTLQRPHKQLSLQKAVSPAAMEVEAVGGQAAGQLHHLVLTKRLRSFSGLQVFSRSGLQVSGFFRGLGASPSSPEECEKSPEPLRPARESSLKPRLPPHPPQSRPGPRFVARISIIVFSPSG